VLGRAAEQQRQRHLGERHGLEVRLGLQFWPDNASYHDIPVAGIISHRQVTDAYLAHLARSYSARLATFDQALAKLHADVVDLIPAG
jgi:predicted nucleic acid-binding protein